MANHTKQIVPDALAFCDKGDGRDFFGRKDEKGSIVSYIDLPAENRIMVLGEPKSGKSSMLKLVEAEIKESRGEAMIVLSAGTAMWSTAKAVLEGLVHALEKETGRKIPASRMQGRFKMKQAVDIIGEFLDSEAGSPDRPKKTMVLIIDKLDYALANRVTNAKTGLQVLLFLRTMLDRLPLKLLFSVTRDPASNSFPVNFGDDFFSESRPVFLGPLEGLDFQDMVQTSLNRPRWLVDSHISFVYEQSGGWPYFAKVVLSHMERRFRSNRNDPECLHDVLEEVAKDRSLIVVLNEIYENHFDNYERYAIALLADRADLCDSDEPLKDSGSFGDALRNALTSLKTRSYVRYYEQRRAHCLLVGLMAHWHRAHSPDRRIGVRNADYLVGLSYHSEFSTLVGSIADRLNKLLKANQVLFHINQPEGPARRDGMAYLANEFKKAALIVVFVSREYGKTSWTAAEWEVIQGVSQARSARVMFVTCDGTMLPGIDDPGLYCREIEKDKLSDAIERRLLAP